MIGGIGARLSAFLTKARTRLAGVKPAGAPRLRTRRAAGLFNATGRAGPRRLVFLVAGVTGIAVVVVMVTTTGQKTIFLSQDARLGAVNPLPGGLHSTPEQDALALKANDALAQQASAKGVSYTPPMRPSQLVSSSPQIEASDPQDLMLPVPAAPAAKPAPVVARPKRQTVPGPLQPVVIPAALRAQVASAPSEPAVQNEPVVRVAAPASDPQVQAAYAAQINTMFSQWGGHAPRTDIVLPEPQPGETGDASGSNHNASNSGAARTPAAAALPVSVRNETSGRILVPAGRGIYAHPILAVNSDASSPVVLQADTGPIAGDRMLGTFAKESNRLVIHINTVIHNGETISADGLVIAPDTMEAGVATSVDQHYLTRFLLPAAAAFVQGLGTALATTSNTTAVLSPLGGATTSTSLNFPQQLGVAAGTAGAQVGSVLNQAAPKGPTVSLEANVAIGVMFLSNVTARAQ